MVDELAALFAKYGYEWKIGGEPKVPNDTEIEAMLDECAEVLYTEPVGTRLTTGRLIVEKRTKTHDVYVYVGSYQ